MALEPDESFVLELSLLGVANGQRGLFDSLSLPNVFFLEFTLFKFHLPVLSCIMNSCLLRKKHLANMMNQKDLFDHLTHQAVTTPTQNSHLVFRSRQEFIIQDSTGISEI